MSSTTPMFAPSASIISNADLCGCLCSSLKGKWKLISIVPPDLASPQLDCQDPVQLKQNRRSSPPSFLPSFLPSSRCTCSTACVLARAYVYKSMCKFLASPPSSRWLLPHLPACAPSPSTPRCSSNILSTSSLCASPSQSLQCSARGKM